MKQIYFHRAIFLSWYCSKGDCSFCYMSTQKDKIKNPKLAKRTRESILAEVYLCKMLKWKIEFLSGGYDSYEWQELIRLIKEIKTVYGKKLWLNIGTLNERELSQLLPYIEGVSAPVECVNPALRKQVCPSKPMDEIDSMLKAADKLNLKKSMTLILGLGESTQDFPYLKTFIEKHNIDQITFYRLKPQKETIFEHAKPITKEYYAEWVKLTKESFPEIMIIAGSWLTQLEEISTLIQSGAEGITKFPSINKFNTKYAKTIEEEVKNAGCIFSSNLTDKSKVKIPKIIDKKVEEKLIQYISSLK